MGKVLESLTPALQEFIERQPVYFVATAPLQGGHVNLSPKGRDSLRMLDPGRVAYLDLTGSGNETSAHLLENGRITLLLCAFDGPPLILRLYGRGRTVLKREAEWAELIPRFTPLPGARQIIVIELTRVQTSCGFGVPLMDFKADRAQLVEYAQTKGEAELEAYRREKNRTSIDGLTTPIGRARS